MPLGDELLLLVMGPGIGESVVVHWPPNHWLVVDSFNRTKGAIEHHPAVDALDLFHGNADAVALTHPHADHTSGFASLIERRKPGGAVGWWAAEDAGVRWNTANALQATRQGATEHALAAIERVWREDPASKWELNSVAPPLHIGGGSIEVLTPLPETVARCQQLTNPDYNEMSSAMLFTWERCRILLGADLVNRRGWESLEQQRGAFAFVETAGMKVAHHGSKEAQHPVALGQPPPADRTFLATPYSRGRKVPDFRDGEDVASLLMVMNRLFITAHHGPRPSAAGTVDTPRGGLIPAELSLGPLTVEIEPERPPIEDCWVAARWSSDGVLMSVDRGPGSMCVVA